MLTDSNALFKTTGCLIESVGTLFDHRKGVPFSAAGIATHAHQPPPAHSDTQLAFDAGDVIFFTTRDSADWWQAVLPDGRSGLVPLSFVRVDVDFDQLDREQNRAGAWSSSAPGGAVRAAAKKPASDVASVVADRVERETLRESLQSAAPGLGVVKSAAPTAANPDEAMEKIMALQNARSNDVKQREAELKIKQLQTRHAQAKSERAAATSSSGETFQLSGPFGAKKG